MPETGKTPSDSNLSRDPLGGSFLAGARVPYDDDSLLGGFRAVAAAEPGRVAVVDGDVRLSYGELDRESNRLARFLVESGVGRGDFVGLAMGRCADLVVSIFAVIKSGGAYLPLDPSYPQSRLARMREIARPAMILTRGKCEGSEVSVDDPGAAWRGCSPEPLPDAADGDAPVYCIFTSGSTGEPKGAVVTRRGFANLTGWYRDEFRFGPSDKTLLLSAPGFDLTQKNFFVPLCAGGCLVMYPGGPFDVALLSRMIREAGITVMNCTPSAFYPLLEAGYSALESLRLVVLGGEPISLSKVGPWLRDARCHAEIANTYGPTECADICAFYRLNEENLDAFPAVPTGRPVSNVQLAILDDALRPADGIGELVIGGHGVGSGYIGDEARTAGKFIPNPMPEFFEGPRVYRTGDLMRMHPGGLLEFLGRADHQIKLRGFRIELGEIESVIAGFPGVRAAAVVVSGEGETAGLVAFISPAGLDLVNLSAHVRARLPEYMVPSRFIGLDAFPMTPHGKMDRLALAKMVPARAGATAPSACSATQSRIRAIWEEILERSSIGLDDAFFDLGGDSISLARMHARVMKDFSRMIPITDLFAHPTIRSLARHLDGGGERGISARERMESQRRAVAAAREARS